MPHTLQCIQLVALQIDAHQIDRFDVHLVDEQTVDVRQFLWLMSDTAFRFLLPGWSPIQH